LHRLAKFVRLSQKEPLETEEVIEFLAEQRKEKLVFCVDDSFPSSG
jgi:hypothetical protein